jgi:hydroxypyruvate reductase
VARILAAAINAVEPATAVHRAVQRDGNWLTIAGHPHDLRDYRRVAGISIGKAGWGMAAALGEILGDKLDTGLIVTKHAGTPPSPRWTVLEGGHPIPDEKSLLAGRRALDLASSLTRNDLLVCLISGGGSALVAVPVEGVSLDDLRALTASLLACGAPVGEINTLRRTLDQVKGGGLARAANGATIVSLILSDVVGNPLEAIASGPTVPNPTSAVEALAVLEKYQLQGRLPASITGHLRSAPASEPPGAIEAVHDSAYIIASSIHAAQAALGQAEAEGLRPYLLRTDLQGEAREAALELTNTLRWAALQDEPVARPACLVATGETTVTLRGDGRGGRNTELALAAAINLADFPGVMVVSLATDGEDGPTDAAGAVVSGETWGRARALGLDPSDYLNRNDSYSFFAALDDLIKPGPTGTNVNDLVLMIAL